MIDDKLTELISEFLSKHTSETSLVNKIKDRYEKSFRLLDKGIIKLTKKLEKEELDIKKSYEQYKENKLSLEKYRLKREISVNHRQNYQAELLELEEKKTFLNLELEKALVWIKNLYTASKVNRLSKELIDTLVDKIIVKNKNEFEIVFTFSVSALTGGDSNE